jgi:hypothetical protein
VRQNSAAANEVARQNPSCHTLIGKLELPIDEIAKISQALVELRDEIRFRWPQAPE